MDLRLTASGRPRRLGVLSGSFHPVTRAHLALAEAALTMVDQVLVVMPRELPHKEYEGVSLDERLDLLRQAASSNERFSVGVTEGGLFIDIARECYREYGPQCELWFVCGRDAAERIIGWDYGSGPGLREQLREYGLLVADRDGRFRVPASLRSRVRRLSLPSDWSTVSATEVRRRIAAGEPWEDLVPERVAAEIRLLYVR